MAAHRNIPLPQRKDLPGRFDQPWWTEGDWTYYLCRTEHERRALLVNHFSLCHGNLYGCRQQPEDAPGLVEYVARTIASGGIG